MGWSCTLAVYVANDAEMVSVTQIDIDEDALAEAMRLSGARTKEEAVNLALREFAAQLRRVERSSYDRPVSS